MRIKSPYLCRLAMPALAIAFFQVCDAQIIFDDDFDGVAASGWLSQGNAQAFSAHNITQADSVLTSEVVATQGNTNRGIVSEESFAPAATDGFTLTFVADSVSNQPGANGYFIGLVRENDVFHRDATTKNFGLAFFGQQARTGSASGFGLVYGDNNNTAAADLILDSKVVRASSFLDGFTAKVSVSQTDWSYEITGLQDSGGANMVFTGNGSWPAAGADFNSLWPAGQEWFLTGATQVVAASTHRISFDRISVENPTVPMDTDSDGMPDDYELANGTDINVDDAAADKDLDGLSNLQEYLGQNGAGESTGFGRTLSGTADSDGDTLSDNDEIAGTANPWSNGNLAEAPGDPTNPNNSNSDNEGENDAIEITNGTDPNAPPPNTGPIFTFTDSDGDSYSDAAEQAFGSNPGDTDSSPDHSPANNQPNLVIIYADDLGFGDISAYGNFYGTPSPTETPNVDALAAAGVMFTQAHSSNGVCTPSRYALLTGKYNWREFNGITNHFGGQMGGEEVPRPSDVTIAEFLKAHSYDTAAFGKWHLGGAFHTLTGTRVTGNPSNGDNIDWARPVEHHAVANGFDTFRGLAATINRGPYVYLVDDRVQYWDTALNAYRDATNADTFRTITAAELSSTVVGTKASTPSLGDPSYKQIDPGPLMIAQAEEYITARASSGDTDPFFAYVSLYSPHFPQAITPPFVGSVGFNSGDFIKEVDHRIGRVINAIDSNGFGDNTIIVFTSDNGPENGAMSNSLANNTDPNGPLRGNKRDVWDGGTRVPFVVRWPGQAAAGLVSNELIWQGDIFASIAAYLRVDLPEDTAPDGESFLNVLRGQQKPQPRRPSIIVSSIRGDLGLKTIDGWKFIDSSGGGHASSWDSANASIPNAAGTNRGTPKQLFRQLLDLGEDDNLIAGLRDIVAIRSFSSSMIGVDLLGEIDQYRTATTAERFPRVADNDADTLPNSYELAYGLDPDSPKDAAADLDGDGNSNRDERIAGTDPSDAADFFRVVNLQQDADQVQLIWSSVSGKSYQLHWSTDLKTWNPGTIYPGTGDDFEATLDLTTIDLANASHAFVRVAIVTSP
ncbi:MAG: arylsulfatase A [Verrucomicrobiales bacterium]|jgi:arylsulfatase A